MSEQPSPENQADEQPSAGQLFVEETTYQAQQGDSWLKRLRGIALLPALAIITGLIIGGLFVAFTDEEIYAPSGRILIADSTNAFTVYYPDDVATAFNTSVGEVLSNAFTTIIGTYEALFKGAIGDPQEISEALASGDARDIRWAFYPLTESLTASVPLILAGLGVALGFRSGLFNIGAEGQLYVGAAAATFVAYSFTDLPMPIHLTLALIAGALGGGFWGMIPGWLKAKTGGHEVINTIMMNYIAFRLIDWLLTGPMQDPEGVGDPISANVLPTAELPRFFESPIRFHLGFFIALALVAFVWWFMFKTKWGFTLRTVGANPNAARYAGINIVNVTVLSMTLSGMLAGLAGANEILGLNHELTPGFSAGIGFDAIAIALLGRNHPIGVLFSALLFGFLRSGATQMTVDMGTPIDIISILQALILMFVAAPAIIRTIYRLREVSGADQEIVLSSWS